jgi:hypothetical protein
MNRHFLVLLLISFAGCTYPTFTNPIVEPANAQRFDDLFGVYHSKHPDTGEISWLHIGQCADTLPDGFHKFVLVSPPSPEKGDQGLTVGEYMGFVFRNDDSYIVQKNGGNPKSKATPMSALSDLEMIFGWTYSLTKKSKTLSTKKYSLVELNRKLMNQQNRQQSGVNMCT